MDPRIRPRMGMGAMLRVLVGTSAMVVVGCAPPAPPPPSTSGRPTPAAVIATHVPGTQTSCPRRLHGEWVAGPGAGTDVAPGELATIQVIVTARLRSTGIPAISVAINGTDGIVVEMPVTSETAALRSLVSATGRFEMIPLPPEEYGTVSTAGAKTVTTGKPLDPKPPALLDGSAVVSALPVSQEAGKGIQLTLTTRATADFAEYTTGHIGDYFAMVMDDLVVAAPAIQAPIEHGVVLVTGDFTDEEANRIATILRFGPLPKPLTESSFSEIPGRCPPGAASPGPVPSPS